MKKISIVQSSVFSAIVDDQAAEEIKAILEAGPVYQWDVLDKYSDLEVDWHIKDTNEDASFDERTRNRRQVLNCVQDPPPPEPQLNVMAKEKIIGLLRDYVSEYLFHIQHWCYVYVSNDYPSHTERVDNSPLWIQCLGPAFTDAHFRFRSSQKSDIFFNIPIKEEHTKFITDWRILSADVYEFFKRIRNEYVQKNYPGITKYTNKK